MVHITLTHTCRRATLYRAACPGGPVALMPSVRGDTVHGGGGGGGGADRQHSDNVIVITNSSS